jgi:nucleotide-binding universal stress UspA family protein
MRGPIICGIDFSEDSRRALRWADAWADRCGARLIVVHAIEPLLASAAAVTYGADTLPGTLEPDLRDFVASTGVTRAHELQIGIGEPARVVHGAALAADAGLMVVGTQGLGRAARLWFGSTTTKLLADTRIPVLAIPHDATETPTIGQFVVGVDFGTASDAAVAAARTAADAWHVPVHCVHVVPAVPTHTRWNQLVATAAESAMRDARARVEALVSAAHGTLTADVQTGDPAEVLIAAAAEGAVIVVGLGGHDAARRPGTIAYRVLSGAAAPVLGVPPRL